MMTRKFFLLALLAAAGLLYMACPTDGGENTENTTPAKETWTVTFDLGYVGGTTPVPIAVEKGKTAGAALPTPVRTDFIFDGWYESTTRYLSYTVITKNITLQAKWIAVYTVTFDLNYTEDGLTPPDPIKIREGESGGILFPLNPSRTDYIFRSWLDGTDKYNAETSITKNVTLKADWFQGYQVTLEVVGGMAEYDPILVERNTAMGSDFPTDPQLPEKFTFDGWFDSSNTKYDASTPVSGDITLTGKFTKDAGVWKVSARNAGNPVFKFTVPAGEGFGNYTRMTVKFLVNDENKATDTPVLRLYGSYAETDFTEQTDRFWKGPPGSYLQFNNISGQTIRAKYEWYTLEVPFDGAKFNEGDFNARFPASTANGDFYFALGLSLGGGSGSAVHVTSYMTEVTLTNADGSKTLVSAGGGFSKPAMIGNVTADITVE